MSVTHSIGTGQQQPAPLDIEPYAIEPYVIEPFVLTEEQATLAYGAVSALGVRDELDDATADLTLRSMLAIGMLELIPPEGGRPLVGQTQVDLALTGPFAAAQASMIGATVVTTVTLEIAGHQEMQAIYQSADGRMLIERALPSGFRAYGTCSADDIARDVDALGLSEDVAAGLSAPVVVEAPFGEIAMGDPADAIVRSIDLLLSYVRTDRASGAVHELVLGDSLVHGRLRLVATPLAPASATALTISPHDWDGRTVRQFLAPESAPAA